MLDRKNGIYKYCDKRDRNVLDYQLKCGYGIERKDWGLCLRSMGAKQGVSGYEAKASVAFLLLFFPAPVTLTF